MQLLIYFLIVISLLTLRFPVFSVQNKAAQCDLNVTFLSTPCQVRKTIWFVVPVLIETSCAKEI